VHAFAAQAECGRQAALAATDHRDVIDIRVTIGARAGPGRAGKAGEFELARDLGLQRGQVDGFGDSHAISSSLSFTILPISASAVAISASLVCAVRSVIAVRMPALFVRRTQMMNGIACAAR